MQEAERAPMLTQRPSLQPPSWLTPCACCCRCTCRHQNQSIAVASMSVVVAVPIQHVVSCEQVCGRPDAATIATCAAAAVRTVHALLMSGHASAEQQFATGGQSPDDSCAGGHVSI